MEYPYAIKLYAVRWAPHNPAISILQSIEISGKKYVHISFLYQIRVIIDRFPWGLNGLSKNHLWTESNIPCTLEATIGAFAA